MHPVLLKLKEKAKSASRKEKDNQFYCLIKNECSILDVGVFPETQIVNKEISKNHFLKEFRFAPEYYTGLSIDSLDGMNELYPNKKFVQYNGGVFPFKTNEFEWAYSNAVIEHVGNYQDKLTFLKEMLRVAQNVFFTTPNKYFPVDAHTMVFFIHWNDRLFWKWRLKNKKWVPKESLNLLSLKEIKNLLRDANVKDYKIIKNRFFGMTMTFSVIVKNSTNCN